MNHEDVFFEFIVQHDILKNYFGEKPSVQKLIGVVGDIDIPETTNAVLIDPNWDAIYESFINLDHNLESIAYIKPLVEAFDLNQTQTYIDSLIKKMIARGISAEKVYVRIPEFADKSFYDEVIEV